MYTIPDFPWCLCTWLILHERERKVENRVHEYVSSILSHLEPSWTVAIISGLSGRDRAKARHPGIKQSPFVPPHLRESPFSNSYSLR